MKLEQKVVDGILSRIGAEHNAFKRAAKEGDKDAMLKQMTRLRNRVNAEIKSLNPPGTDNRANQLNPNNPLSPKSSPATQKKNNPPNPKKKQ